MSKRVIVLVAVAGVMLLACSRAIGDPPAQGATGFGEEGSAGPATGGIGMEHCAFEFSPVTLAERDWAFDGTLLEIREPSEIEVPHELVFAVTRWYRGNAEDATVTLRSYGVSGSSLSGDLELEVGDRILAAGDEDFLWGCGFSRDYSVSHARLFEEVFA